MKRGNYWIGSLFCLLVSIPLWASPPSISVDGRAEVKVVPDEVELTLGVETFDPELSKAKAANDERVGRILEAARAAGIPVERIQTDFLEIEPRYDHRDGQRIFEDFVVRKTIVLTSRDIDGFETLLTDVLESGANYVHGITFRTTELRAHRDRARALALQAAKEKATAMADTLGQAIGSPLSISEGYSGWSSNYGGWWGRGSGSAMQNVYQVVPGDGAGLGGATPPGQIAVNASVTVSFELSDASGERGGGTTRQGSE